MKYTYTLIRQPYNFYDTDQRTRELLTQAFSIKLTGYKRAHREIACPIDKNDFFCDHLIVLDQKGKVVSAYNITTPKMAKDYNSKFALRETIKDSYSEKDLDYIDKYIESRNENIGYSYSWGMCPSIPKQDKKEIMDFALAAVFHYFNEYKVDTIIDINVLALKVHKLKEWMGYSHFDRELPPVMAYGSKCNMMFNEDLRFSDEFMEVVNRFSEHWKHREEISVESLEELKEAA
jgi:hypothetical protein